MPEVRTYKAGSIIYLEDKSNNNFAYLLKSGKLTRTKLSLETSSYESSPLSVGEFFGIKAALGITFRDETIRVASDATVYVFTPQEFLAFMKKNVNIIFKMMRAFSNELRRIHHAIVNILAFESDLKGDHSDSDKLRSIGTYYLKQKAYTQAEYVFRAYLKHYPNSEHIKEVKDHLDLISSIGQEAFETEENLPAKELPIKSENFFLDLPEMLEKEKEDTAVKVDFNSALDAYETKNYTLAKNLLEQIETQTHPKEDKSRFMEKLLLLRAKIFYHAKQYHQAINATKEFVNLFPSSIWTSSALLVVAESFLKQDNIAKTKVVYEKILLTPGREALKKMIKQRLDGLNET